MTAVEPAALRLGAMLKCAPLEDAFEYRFMFDLTANTFLQKLIPTRVMQRKLALAPGSYFRSLLVLSYATAVLGGGDKLLDNIDVLSAELRRLDPKALLPLGLIVTEIALHAAEQGTALDEEAFRARFALLDAKRCACDPAQIDPFYEAVGHMLGDQLAMKGAAARVSSKGEYLAAAFADALLPHLKEDADAVAGRLLRGEYREASLDALRACARTATLADLERYFQP